VKILFDQGTPAPLREALAGHVVATAYERGLAAVRNGDLIEIAEAEFDLFITTDRSLRHQQRLPRDRLAIIVLLTTSWPKIRVQVQVVVDAVDGIRPEQYLELNF